jgi:hypothetical protein
MKTGSLHARSLGVLGAVAFAAAAWAPSADAARSPTAAQRSAITKAVQTASVAGLNTLPRSHYKVTGVKISTVNPNWAVADLTPVGVAKTTLQSGYGVLVLLAGTKTWVLLDFGSAGVGCGYLSSRVLNDLVGKGASNECQS